MLQAVGAEHSDWILIESILLSGTICTHHSVALPSPDAYVADDLDVRILLLQLGQLTIPGGVHINVIHLCALQRREMLVNTAAKLVAVAQDMMRRNQAGNQAMAPMRCARPVSHRNLGDDPFV